MRDGIDKFMTGFVFGAGVLFGILLLLGATPKHMQDKMQQQAIDHGAAKWVLNTNVNPPQVKFEWITHTNYVAER